MVQGLSAGGEAGVASAFVVEYAPADRRGGYGGWIWATLALGRVGRRPLLAAATVALVVLTLPIYLLVRGGDPGGLLLGYLALGVVLSCFVLPSFPAELFPTEVRASGLAVTYGVGSAPFGGTAPLVHTLLLQRTGDPLLPAWYVTAVALAAAIAVLPLRETAFEPLDAAPVAGRRGFTPIG
jgi:MHS family proline/betaine transporter-like MFS transporter